MADIPWSEKASIPHAVPDSRQPAIAVSGESPHAVWVRARTLYHSFWSPSGWSRAVKAGTGERPATVATADGRLHCVFTGTLFGKSEIYHVSWDGSAWSLPQVISRTRGLSLNPAIASGPDGALHVVWSDTTPGYSVIYHARQHGALWTSVPVPNARGGRPTVAVASDGAVHVAWQHRLRPDQPLDIYAALCRTGRWENPQNVSDYDEGNSINPRLAATPEGFCHLVWQEERDGVFMIRHADRRPVEWSSPSDVSAAGKDTRQPHIMAEPRGLVQILWLEGPKVMHRACLAEYDGQWWDQEVACIARGGINELSGAIAQSGELHALWSGYVEGGALQLFSARRAPFQPKTTAVAAG